MYQIQPYDLSESFKFIPEKKKYSLLFKIGQTVSFSSKREAFHFISKLSNFFVETLALCEMTHTTINSYSFHIKPNTKANTDYYNIYHNNSLHIFEIIRDLKFYQSDKTKLDFIYLKFTHLIGYILDNCRILNKKNNNCVLAYYSIMQKLSDSFYRVTSNSEAFYNEKKLTLFPI